VHKNACKIFLKVSLGDIRSVV